MKRVIFFSHSQAMGGAELSMLEIMASLDRSRIEPVLLAIGEGDLSAKALGLGAKVLRSPVPARLADWKRGADIGPTSIKDAALSAVKLAAMLRRLRPFVLYTHSQKAHVMGGLAGRMAGVPVVWHAREFLDGTGLRLVMASLSRFAPSRIICVSESVSRQFDGARGKVAVIPNGVDIGEARRRAMSRPLGEARRNLAPDNRRPLVGMVSRIAPGKGQHVFIEAASMISEKIPKAGFLIVGGALFGEGDYLHKLRRQADGLGLGGRISFTGHLENPLPAMKALDVLVHCPVAPEGFGRSVTEAMALGVPVAASRNGGIPELIEDGVNGLLVEPGDSEGLAKAVILLLSDKALALRLARAAREKIETRFTMETALAAIERTLLAV